MNVKINEANEPDTFNWSKPQLLARLDGTELLYYGGKGNPSSSDFNGLDLKTGEVDNYLKEQFKPFNGTITLSND